jgi:selenoprotein W-related protein
MICMSHHIEIVYCTQCRWLLRANWMAQELLSTFDDEIAALTLRPGRGGVFEVLADGEPVWSRAAEGRFPEIGELKRRVRDRIAPGRALGHIDRAASKPAG